MWTFALDDDAALDRARAGGKGVGLARLRRAGLPVPAAFVVDASAMRAVLEALEEPESSNPSMVWSDAVVRAEAARRAARLRSAPLPATLVEEVSAVLAALGDGAAIAVRSSAIDEDGATRSAAGQLDTVLDVRGLDAVLAAIRTCWASAHGHRAAIYRARTGRAPFDATTAVILQAMAPTDQSGVVFTRDPIHPARPTVVIESHPTPEAVVQGTTLPTRHHLPRPTGAVHPQIRYAAHAGNAAFGAAHLHELAALAIRGEAALGAPADIEWAWSATSGFQLLQLRAITGRAARPGGGRGILWTQRFSGERWTEPATSLGWSIVRPALERFTHWPWASRAYLGGSSLARVHAGTPYFNVTIFRHLLPQTPWTPTPEFVLELFPAAEQEEIRRRRWHLPTPGLVALVLAEALLRGRWRGHRFLWSTNPRDWGRLAPRIENAARAALAAPPPADSAAAIRALTPLVGWLERYVGVHVWSLLWANLFYQLLGVWLMRTGGAALHARRPALVVGAGRDNLTLRTNMAVWRLAAIAHVEPVLERQLLDAQSGAAALDAVRTLRDGAGSAAGAARHFLTALDELLARYGHRSRATWEVFSRRWRDEPETVLEMVRAYLRAGAAADPWAREELMMIGRVDADRALDGALNGWRLRLARWAVERTRVFSLLRENQRFVFDRLMLAIREVCLHAGARLATERRLARAEDVVHLELDEIASLSRGTLSAVEAARRIAVRKADIARAAGSPSPIFLVDDEEIADVAAAPLPPPRGAAGDRILHGLGISPGRISGIARIARSLSDLADLKPGEILVVKATDPGWTPYFSAAGGLVTELGGLLSHAAVVAREYGLPAVANIVDATSILQNGDVLTIDGTSGVVWCGNK